MKKVVLIFIGAILLSIISANVVVADNGPHGGYSNFTDKCAACHRAHTAQSEDLLTAPATATDKSGFCYSCHSGGMGAYTDVKNGLFVAGAKAPLPPVDTAVNPGVDMPLRGGGFEQVRMNPDTLGSQNLPTTSSHMVTGGSNTVWGYGAISATANPGQPGVALTCTNCHDPHGRAAVNVNGVQIATYRLLKGNNPINTPLFTTGVFSVTSTINLPDENGQKNYYLDDGTGNVVDGVDYTGQDLYFGQHAFVGMANVYSLASAWCAQCHTRYNAPPTGPYGQAVFSGDAVFQYRHKISTSVGGSCFACHDVDPTLYPNTRGSGNYPRPGCLNCHVAHGTGARATGWAGDTTYVPWPDGSTTPNGNARSVLLRLDSRGVCQMCHQK